MMEWDLIDSVSLEKPAFGSSCNQCGMCCIAEVCQLGLELGDDKNCKALIDSPDGTFNCGLVVDPYRYKPENDLVSWKRIDSIFHSTHGEDALKSMYIELLGAGIGCDSDDQDMQERVQSLLASRQKTSD